jgi:hypothetical protein
MGGEFFRYLFLPKPVPRHVAQAYQNVIREKAVPMVEDWWSMQSDESRANLTLTVHTDMFNDLSIELILVDKKNAQNPKAWVNWGDVVLPADMNNWPVHGFGWQARNYQSLNALTADLANELVTLLLDTLPSFTFREASCYDGVRDLF